ncbi:very short patch repair endonuclease [Luteibacter sp. 9135]|uniref:very short patch repair endonuclease n=1 Tax=Luteibacter sp. 9135 TaxID=1500893 RepID=UPI0009DEFBE6|nr:very short patch repair endonuclease [Luteibacter sp. 9135]
MADIMTSKERSERMSRIRGKDTKPEMQVRQFLHGRGFRYRLHVKDMPGRPDMVLPKYGAVVLVDGCFWHGHVCQGGRIPGNNSVFWQAKIAANQARDLRNQKALASAGWKVIRVWECQLSTKKMREKTLTRLAARLEALQPSQGT